MGRSRGRLIFSPPIIASGFAVSRTDRSQHEGSRVWKHTAVSAQTVDNALRAQGRAARYILFILRRHEKREMIIISCNSAEAAEINIQLAAAAFLSWLHWASDWTQSVCFEGKVKQLRLCCHAHRRKKKLVSRVSGENPHEHPELPQRDNTLPWSDLPAAEATNRIWWGEWGSQYQRFTVIIPFSRLGGK